MPAPIVSIVLPVYNGDAALRLALASIYWQSFPDWELILIDDGSTNGCLLDFSAPDSRVRLIQDRRNLGLAARLNQGIDLARGKYLARMDADDVAYPGRLQAQVKFLDAYPDIDLVATRAMVFRDDGSAAGLFPFRQTHAEICAAPWRGFYFPHPAWMGRIGWFRHHRYRLPEVVRAEDQELLLRSYSVSRFACLPQVLMGYRQTGFSLTRILAARRQLALAQWSVNRDQGRPAYAVLGLLVSALKAAVDAVAGLMGVKSFFVVRMVRAAPKDELERWAEIWSELQEAVGSSSPSRRVVDAAR